MHKRTTPIEWHVAESDAEWQRLCAPPLPGPEGAPTPDPAAAAQRRLSAQRFLGGVAVILLLLASGAVWWWRTDQVGGNPRAVRATAQHELAVVVQRDDPLATSLPDDQTAADGQRQGGQADSSLPSTVKAIEPAARVDIALPTFEVQGDQAVARSVVYTGHGEPAYRQTRFYRHTEEGWQQTAPDASLWGPLRRLETPSFVYHFRQNDASAITAVLPQVEALYTNLRQNFGLPITDNAEKLVIEVSVTQPPGYATPWLGAPERILVPSPAVYLAPVELSDADLLAQSIALTLLEQMLAKAREQYQIDAAWRPVVGGLRLWQLWDLDLPLATWREEMVQWIYLDVPAGRQGQPVVLPERYAALCTTHKLWMPSPTQISIPLLCAEVDWEDFLLSPWGWYDPPMHLDQLRAPLRAGEYLEEPNSLDLVYHPGQTVALATLIDYAVAAYGRERLPALVAGLGQYESWDTLLPAVFGVSAAEFEAGWQAYLATHYDVP